MNLTKLIEQNRKHFTSIAKYKFTNGNQYLAEDLFQDAALKAIKEVIELLLKGFKYNEIVEITRLPLTNVRVRIFHAKKKLKELLKGYELNK